MSDPILQMRGITKTFPGVKALSDVSLSVARGEIHAICGENGAGKSTLMKVLSGVYPHGTYSGEIIFEGERAVFHSINDSEAKGIVIIHQELALSPYLSVAENIFLGNERADRAGLIDWNRTNADAAQLLARVGLEENPTTPISQLGVGKQQLVEIAKALSKKVKLLILDEPTAALNDEDSEHLLDLLRHLKGQGITSIMISHKLVEVEEIADSTTILRDGKTIETIAMPGAAGAPESAMPGAASAPESAMPRAASASESPKPVPEGVPEARTADSFPIRIQDRIIRGMVGRDLEHRYPQRESHPGEEIFRVEDWTVHHPIQPDRVVVDHAGFTVRAGEVVGIAGLMGAGRTELAMSIFGHSWGRDISGQVYMHGKPVDTSTVSRAIAAGIAYATEDRKRYGLNLIEDVRRNISAAALGKLARSGWVDGNEELAVADRYRTDLGIRTPSVLAPVGKLSGGNQQKVALAKWLFTEPEVLLLDEPTRGIDVGAKYEIFQLVNRMVADGKAVVVISSELPEILGTCDRIYTLAYGRITGNVPIGEATQERLMELMTMEKEPVR